jgi:hypothetical protein
MSSCGGSRAAVRAALRSVQHSRLQHEKSVCKWVPVEAIWGYDSVTACPPASGMENKHKSGEPDERGSLKSDATA